MSRNEASQSLPEPIRAVLDLFSGPLAEVRFPDIDHARLGEAAAHVEAQRLLVQQALEQVQVAREALELAQRQLNEQARRAHAYATVYAETDPALAEQVAAIKLAPRKLAPRKKRSRARKSSEKQQTNLSVEDAA